MNKKFSTLLATALVAGALNTVNAVDFKDVANNGKYYSLEQTGAWTSGGSWTQELTPYFMTWDADNKVIFTPAEDEQSYWTVVTKQTGGKTYYQLKDANGKAFSYTYTNAAGDEVKVDWFLQGYENKSTYEVNSLFFEKDGAREFINVGAGRLDGTFDISSNATAARGWDLKEISDAVLSQADMNAVLKTGFQLQFTAKGKEYKNLQGNVFTGKLQALAGETAGTYYFYRPSDKKYIVLTEEVWSDNTANLDGKATSEYRGYKFNAISKHSFDQLEDKKNAEFKVFTSKSFNDADSLIVTMPSVTVGDATEENVKLFVSNVADKNYLTVISEDFANDKLESDLTIDAGSIAPYIKFGASDIVSIEDFAGKAWNITLKSNGYVLNPMGNGDIDNVNYDFIPAEQVELTAPEGQWLPTSAEGFVNRESGLSYNPFAFDVRKIAEATYRIYYTESSYTDIIVAEAEKAELGKTEKGYANYDVAKEALNGKYLTLKEAVTGNTVYVATDKDDNVVLTTDKESAIEFRIKEIKHDYTSHDGLAGVDTLQHYTTYLGFDKDGNLKADCQDTVQFAHYMLYEHFSEKYLTYDAQTKKYVMTPYSRTNNAHEDFSQAVSFVVKVKGDGTFNLIRDYEAKYPNCAITDGKHTPVEPNYYDPEFDNDFEANLDGAHKVYGAFQTASLADMNFIYNYNDNDRFALETVATPEYMTITADYDTIKVSRFGNEKVLMFEQNNKGTNFLAMEHMADVEDMKAAILADTAYVRNNTFKPQYLLGVGTNIVAEEYCSRPDLHASLHKDTVYGRFLINMVDSAYAYGISKKSNPYTWDKSNFFKLGFIDGYHTNDSLHIVKEGKVAKQIFLGNNNDKVCTFAFRYTDANREGVKMETLHQTDANGNPVRGWVKWHNGIPVVIDDYAQADVFAVNNQVDEAPTSNDAITASEVQIIAGAGSVIVKGAAGKTVAISNILGQTIVNTVLSSDNATIAVPAGIVVVAVEGEEAVKTVVR